MEKGNDNGGTEKARLVSRISKVLVSYLVVSPKSGSGGAIISNGWELLPNECE